MLRKSCDHRYPYVNKQAKRDDVDYTIGLQFVTFPVISVSNVNGWKMPQSVSYVQFCLIITFVASSDATKAQNADGRSQPHILLVVADDFGWNDVGYHGSEIKTPNLDELAASGVKLDNYYVQPICTPTRSQLMSGRYQIHTGLQHSVIHPQQAMALPKDLPTLADVLKGEGYSTHIVGKWHLGNYKEEFFPTNRGFDSYYGYLIGAEDYYNHSLCEVYNVNDTKKSECGLDFRHNTEVVRDQQGKYSTHVFRERAESLIENHALYDTDQPMFLYLPFQAVHAPLEVPDSYTKPYSFIKDKARRTYAGMVSAMDEAIGNVTRKLKEHNMWENTIMVFTTDNGGTIFSGGNNWPLRGWKAQLWEGGVRGVGFVAGNVNKARVGAVCKGLMHVSDWFPTLLGLAGGTTHGLTLDGFDVWKTINEGKSSPRRELLHNIDPLEQKIGQRWSNSSFDNRVRAAIRVGDWKLLTGSVGEGRWVPPPHVMSLEAALGKDFDATSRIPSKDKQNVWLFNIAADPLEKHDLSARYPSRVLDMLERLARYNSTAVPCRYPGNDPASNPQLLGGVWGPWM